MFDTGALSALFSGFNAQQPQPALAIAPAPVAAPTGPMANIQSLFGGGDITSLIRQIGGGMANMGPTGGDPYLAFAQGFGGTQKYATDQTNLAAQRAAEAEKIKQDQALALQRLTQDQSQFDARLGQDQSQFNTQNELAQAADKRAQLIAEQSAKKSEAEIARMAKQSGISTDQMLSIERIAQAEAENILDPDARRTVVEKKRAELTAQVKQNLGISTGPGITAEPPKVGDVEQTPEGSWMFKGGDPSNPASWQKQ